MNSLHIQNKDKQRGIAVIVVVAIMVALIMVTTALLATVRRSTASARVYFQKDIARVAALSGRAAAMYAIHTSNALAAGTKEKAVIYDFYKYNSSGDHACAAAAAPLSMSSPSATQTAHGLEPYARVGIAGRTYGKCLAIRPPFSLLESSNDTKVIYNAGATTDLTSSSTFTADDATYRDFMQVPSSGGTSYPYCSYVNLNPYDKMLSTSLEIDPLHIAASISNSFYISRYAFYIQDLGGCFNLFNNAAGQNNYDDSYMVKLLNMAAGYSDTATTFLNSTQLGNLKSTFQYNDDNIASVMGIYNHEFQGPRQLITSFGKMDKSTTPVPLCVNIYTASPKIINAMVRGVILNASSVVKVYNNVTEIGLTELNNNGDDGTTSGVDTVVSLIRTARNSKENITSIANSMSSNTTNLTDNQALAAKAVALILLGVMTDFDGSGTLDTTDSDYLIEPGTSLTGSTKVKTTVPATTLAALNLGRLVGYSSSDNTADIATAKMSAPFMVHADTVGPGPFFRILARGALVNLGKSELAASADYECVYDAVNKKIVYQRWYENE